MTQQRLLARTSHQVAHCLLSGTESFGGPKGHPAHAWGEHAASLTSSGTPAPPPHSPAKAPFPAFLTAQPSPARSRTLSPARAIPTLPAPAVGALGPLHPETRCSRCPALTRPQVLPPGSTWCLLRPCPPALQQWPLCAPSFSLAHGPGESLVSRPCAAGPPEHRPPGHLSRRWAADVQVVGLSHGGHSEGREAVIQRP